MAVIDLIGRVTRRIGVNVERYSSVPPDFSPSESALVQAVRPFTMTSPERIVALANAIRWVVGEDVPGAVVECGVWRGGSMMVVARTLLDMGVPERELYLFDTFEGMSAPTDEDEDLAGQPARERFSRTMTSADTSDWCRAGINDVGSNLDATGYPAQRVHLVPGKVEDTIPQNVPDTIALLRLDTDWYVSTRHELEHLWPRLAPGGICIIDDYGHWRGSRRAVDEYFADHHIRVLMHRLDYTGRLIVKA